MAEGRHPFTTNKPGDVQCMVCGDTTDAEIHRGGQWKMKDLYPSVASTVEEFNDFISKAPPGSLIMVTLELSKKLRYRDLMKTQVIQPVLEELKEEVKNFTYNPISAPEHYLQTKISAAEVIADWELDFFLGSVLKYINRYKYKNDALLDLQKARQYLTMEIELIEKGELKDSIKRGA